MTHSALARRYRTGEGYACAARLAELGGEFEVMAREGDRPPALLRVRTVACLACGVAYRLSARTVVTGRARPFPIDANTPRRRQP